ncbi:MAG: PleD family two-component system response regulator, partial [Chloroflexi bacterium CG07_land_8_20_14_0_80_51_10]
LDLVILDVMLPGMDGFDICHRLRGQPGTAHLPILMFSAKAQEIDRDTGLNLGANDYIIKPADSSKILEQVRRLLSAKPAANDRVSS